MTNFLQESVVLFNEIRRSRFSENYIRVDQIHDILSTNVNLLKTIKFEFVKSP